MKIMLLAFFILTHISAYQFVLVNSTEIDDQDIIDKIEGQINNYYDHEKNEIEFMELENKEEVLTILNNYDYSGDKDEQQNLIRKYEDVEDDLNIIFSTKYILIVSEKLNRDGRYELEVVLKVNDFDYFDGSFVMPNIDEKESHYIDTITNIVLTYLVYKDKSFINIHQL